MFVNEGITHGVCIITYPFKALRKAKRILTKTKSFSNATVYHCVHTSACCDQRGIFDQRIKDWLVCSPEAHSINGFIGFSGGHGHMKMAYRGNGPVRQGANSVWAWQKVNGQPT